MLKPPYGAIAPYSSVTKKDSLILIFFCPVNSKESLTELKGVNLIGKP